MKPFFITTAIDYTNGAPHIGHAYEKVLADVMARFHRASGEEVFFLTGVDQHGQKVQQSAERQGVAPQEYVDGVTVKFRALWEKLGIGYTGWAATTDSVHKECVRANLRLLWKDKVPGTDRNRWIYRKTQRGFYSVRQEQFLTDKERGPDGEFGPEWQPVEEREEENFYFRLTAHPDLGFDPKQWLIDLIDRRDKEGNSFVVPGFRVAELRNAVEKLEGDLCISRPASRLQWGIPFPEEFGEGFVTYVWFDALVNYITFAPGHDPNYGVRGAVHTSLSTSFSDWWPPLHVIGKDILIPAHGVYWPIMLKALGFSDAEMPTLLVHGWWNIRGKGGSSEKMSKSLGNVVDPDILADRYGAAAVRYYLMSDIATGRDADFSEERLVQRYNVDLANGLGNLVNRTLNMTRKYREGSPRLAAFPEDLASHLAGNSSAFGDYLRFLRAGQIQSGLERLGDVVNRANALVDTSAPWKLAKDPEQAERLDAVLSVLLLSARTAATMLLPVLPEAAAEILIQLNLNAEPFAMNALPELPEGYRCGEPKPVFPRLELAAEEDAPA
jgi:methionyl-tRNA synthetase